MQNKSKIAATIILILLMTSVTLMTGMAVKPAQAALSEMLNETQSPPPGVTPFLTQWTKAFLSIRDNVIGLGQTNVFNVWISPSIETNRRYMNNITKAFEVVLTKPDGSVVKLYPGNANSEATQWTPYTVDQVGLWTAQFNFKGTYFPPMVVDVGVSYGVPAGTLLHDLYMQPSSSPVGNFTVQQDPMQSWPPSPLPTGYWEWPIDIHNREWWSISGGWPMTAYDASTYSAYFDMLYPGCNPRDIGQDNQGTFVPFVTGPNSAHVLRANHNLATGGINGGPAGITSQLADDGYPSVVYHGRCYKTVTKVMPDLVNGTYRSVPQSVAECFDLRTGEVYYDIPIDDGGVTPTMIVYDQGAQTQSDTPTYTPELLGSISGGRLIKINPTTGAVTTNVSIAPLNTGATLISQMDEQWLSVQNAGTTANPSYRLINWTSVGSSTNYTTRIWSNTSYARSSLPSYRDWNTGLGATVSGYEIEGTRQGQNCTGYDLWTGQTLWTKNVSEPAYSSINVADHGKLAILSMFGFFVCMDLRTGNELWRSPTMNYPFGANAFGVYGVASAYGMIFRNGYDGLYAFNWTTGAIQWYAPRLSKAFDESTYTSYLGGPATYAGQTQVRIADGKVYIYSGEHSPNQPVTRGWSLYCYDVYTGKELWELPIGGSIMFSTPPSTGPIVDGYLYFPSTDGVTYIIGIGKSATTVTASPKTLAQGAQVLIEGSVLDQSPAQPGTPCVAEESMTTQMSYLHLQYPIAGIYGNLTITGVPVTLTAVGSDGTSYNVGTTTTNGYYGTFAMAWTPPKADTYTIMANYAGSAAYDASGASTSVAVSTAPAANNTSGTTVNTAPDNTNLLYGILVAVIIAIVLALAALIRKK